MNKDTYLIIFEGSLPIRVMIECESKIPRWQICIPINETKNRPFKGRCTNRDIARCSITLRLFLSAETVDEISGFLKQYA
jgi:hypothetical protein